MGNVPSLKMEVVPADPVTWWLDEVKALRNEYNKRASDQWCFAASEKQLRGVFEEVLPDPADEGHCHRHDLPEVRGRAVEHDGRPDGCRWPIQGDPVNVLEVWAAFAIVCIGSIEDKLSFIFDLFRTLTTRKVCRIRR